MTLTPSWNCSHCAGSWVVKPNELGLCPVCDKDAIQRIIKLERETQALRAVIENMALPEHDLVDPHECPACEVLALMRHHNDTVLFPNILGHIHDHPEQKA